MESPMGNALCSCGAVTLSLPAQSGPVVACHCIDCQRRTGAPFGAGVFYPAEDVGIAGTTTEFPRNAASGGRVHSYFCPTRSEEHTSELQSLMRTSYAVLCLKTQTHTQNNNLQIQVEIRKQ